MTDPRMTPTNDAPVTVERTLAAGRIIDIMTGGKFDWRSRLEDSDFLESADWLTALAYADAALASAPVEPAWHTDLGGLIEARRVAQAAYKDIERAKAQNTHIPGNPYDVALAALNPALGMLAILVEQPASAPAGDGAAADWLNTLPGVKPSDQFIAADRRLFEGLIDRVRVAALARPRAAVGERTVTLDPDFVDEAMQDAWNDICDDTGSHPLDLKHGRGTVLYFHPGHWARAIAMRLSHRLALQSPPAKVEG
ncbi:hypothetical protein [Sphingomonas hankookensis]|uniref:hypothetical protein n=1 Tax=Sphingomonas hankookensis TaxID=563996 RepID=UPI003F79FE2A